MGNKTAVEQSTRQGDDGYVYLEFIDPEANSRKFWEATRRGAVITTRWGRIGSSGSTKEEDCSTVVLAVSSYTRQVAAKMDKGYVVRREQGERMRQVGDTLHALGKE